MATDVAIAQQIARIAGALEFDKGALRLVDKALEAAEEGPAQLALGFAVANLSSAQDHLERALRLVDPTSTDPLVRRADELVTDGGSHA